MISLSKWANQSESHSSGRELLGVTSLHFVTSPNVPNAGLNATAEVASNDVWAVGSSINSSTNLLTPLAEHFNGTSWSVVPTATLPSGTAGQLKSVVAVASNNVWAVGDNTGPLVEHWDGTKWSIVSTPSVAAAGTLNAVTATSATDVWAVGQAGGHNLIEHFNGTSWSVVPSPIPRNSHLSGVSGTSSSDVWAVGSRRAFDLGPGANPALERPGLERRARPVPRPRTLPHIGRGSGPEQRLGRGRGHPSCQ